MNKILTEGLKHMDMKNQILPLLGIDQYKSSVGDDDDLITLNFVSKSKAAAEDLAEWFEKGYDWVVDAEPSPGEITSGKFFVFVEMSRRAKGAEQIMEMIDDLETLTGLKTSEWKFKIGEETEAASLDFIKKNIQLTPHDYRVVHEEPLNEWRQIAGIQTTNTYNDDEDMKAMKRRAGIF
jgi:hypothetical protein